MKALTTAMLVLALALTSLADEKHTPPTAEIYPAEYQFLFFAVLEGCYRDGVDAQDLAYIIPPTDKPELPDLYQNFVYACPICTPIYEAFRLYSSRKPFAYQKTKEYDTFGTGLPQETKKELAATPGRCRTAVQKVVRKWVHQRINLLRLTKDEEGTLRAKLEEMKEQGEKFLKKYQEEPRPTNYDDWENCPNCEGASPMGS